MIFMLYIIHAGKLVNFSFKKILKFYYLHRTKLGKVTFFRRSQRLKKIFLKLSLTFAKFYQFGEIDISNKREKAR